MAWNPDFSEATPDPRLTPFRRAIGQLVLSGEVMGHIATEVSEVAEKAGGWLWWRSWRVQEFISLTITQATADSALPDWDDPWLFPSDIEAHARMIADLGEGKYEYPDVRMDSGPDLCYEVRWLTGVQFEDAWREFGPQPPINPVEIRR